MKCSVILFQKMFPIRSSLAQKSIEHVYVGAQKFGTVVENYFKGCVQVRKDRFKMVQLSFNIKSQFHSL